MERHRPRGAGSQEERDHRRDPKNGLVNARRPRSLSRDTTKRKHFGVPFYRDEGAGYLG